jgi:ribosomal protein L23
MKTVKPDEKSYLQLQKTKSKKTDPSLMKRSVRAVISSILMTKVTKVRTMHTMADTSRQCRIVKSLYT